MLTPDLANESNDQEIVTWVYSIGPVHIKQCIVASGTAEGQAVHTKVSEECLGPELWPNLQTSRLLCRPATIKVQLRHEQVSCPLLIFELCDCLRGGTPSIIRDLCSK